MQGWEFWTVAVIAAFLTGVSKGGLPLVGALVVPVMSLAISPVAAAGLMLPVYVVSDWFGLYAYRKEFDKRVLVIACVGMTVGVGVGWSIARYISEDWVTALVGTIAVAFSLNTLLRKTVVAGAKTPTIGKGMFWCTIAGFTSFVSHAGGPPAAVFLLSRGLSKTGYQATSVLIFWTVNIAKFIPYAFLGMFTLETAKANLVLAPFALLGAWIGVRAPRCAGTRIFRPDLCAADRNRGQARLGGADLISGVISLGRKGLNHLLKRLARRDKACNP